MASIRKMFHKGDVIIHEGHHAGNFYVIDKGRVEVVKQKSENEIRLSVLGSGEFFGEMGLLDPDKDTHSATVRALEETSVTIMSREDFDGYVEKLPPGMRNLLRQLAHRLRQTSIKVDESVSAESDEDAEPHADGDAEKAPQPSTSQAPGPTAAVQPEPPPPSEQTPPVRADN